MRPLGPSAASLQAVFANMLQDIQRIESGLDVAGYRNGRKEYAVALDSSRQWKLNIELSKSGKTFTVNIGSPTDITLAWAHIDQPGKKGDLVFTFAEPHDKLMTALRKAAIQVQFRCTYCNRMKTAAKKIQKAYRRHYGRRKQAAGVIADAYLHHTYKPGGTGYRRVKQDFEARLQSAAQRTVAARST